MKMQLFLASSDSGNPQLETLLFRGLNVQATSLRKMEPIQEFSIELKNEEDQLMGGAVGITFYGCVYIDMLWIDPQVRENGWGTKIMQQAEAIGKKRGCTFATVNTMEWEALGFYQKLGYEIEFVREGFDKKAKMFLLRKSL